MHAATRVPLELLLDQAKILSAALRFWCWFDHRCRQADGPYSFYWRPLAAELDVSENTLRHKAIPRLAELGWLDYQRPDVPARTTVQVQVDTRVAHHRAVARTRIPLALLESPIGYTEAVNFTGFKLWCWVNHHNLVRDAPLTTSQNILLRQLGLDHKASRRAIRQLEAAGWLRVEKLHWNYGFVLDARHV